MTPGHGKGAKGVSDDRSSPMMESERHTTNTARHRRKKASTRTLHAVEEVSVDSRASAVDLVDKPGTQAIFSNRSLAGRLAAVNSAVGDAEAGQYAETISKRPSRSVSSRRAWELSGNWISTRLSTASLVLDPA